MSAPNLWLGHVTTKVKRIVGGLNPGCEISSLSDGKLAWWSTVSCGLVLAYRPSVSRKGKKKEKKSWEGLYYRAMKMCVYIYIKREGCEGMDTESWPS